MYPDCKTTHNNYMKYIRKENLTLEKNKQTKKQKQTKQKQKQTLKLILIPLATE